MMYSEDSILLYDLAAVIAELELRLCQITSRLRFEGTARNKSNRIEKY